MPFEERKEIACNVAGCQEKVKPSTLTSHFQEHFREYSRQSAAALASMTELSCDQCPRKFRYRKALDHHVKKAHGEQVKKEQSGQKIIEPDLNKILRTCNICEKIV